MNKAIFVLDEMPKKCCECPCFDHDYVWCQVVGRSASYLDRREEFCPLKELPSIKPELIMDIIHHESFDCGYNNGWNQCLDYICGNGEAEE